jgi:CubicO group peptidase (beta-lactamase class C family)
LGVAGSGKSRLSPEAGRLVDELVAGAQARGRVPSLQVAVVRDGAVVHVAAAGETPAPTPITQYRIGSITKTMTAALVLQLRDEGRLALDDLLYRHLPGTPVGGVTLRQLLGHVAGLQREPDGDQWWERSAGVDLDSLLERLTPEKLAHPPHRGYHYSNLAYGLLGAVLHRVTGEDWPALLGKRLLDPLRLRRTTYHPVEPFARGYVVHPWHGTLREEPRHDSGAMAPAGQLWSTTTDLAGWAGFLTDPAPAVLAPATVAEMCTPVAISDPDRWTSGHGLGMQLWRVGERVYAGHAGSMPGYLAVLAVHRPTRTGVVAVANAYTLRHGGIVQFGTRILTDVLDREPVRSRPWRPPAAPPPEVAALCGRWWWMGREFEVAWDAGALVIADREGHRPPSRFVPDGTDRWRGSAGPDDGEVLAVRRDAGGGVDSLDIATFVFSRDPDRPPDR